MSKYDSQPQPKHGKMYRFADWSTGFLKRRKERKQAMEQKRVVA